MLTGKLVRPVFWILTVVDLCQAFPTIFDSINCGYMNERKTQPS